MSRRTAPSLACLAALLAALPGCAGGGPISARRTTMGTLKSEVARLEGRNQQDRARIAELEADRRRLSEQLAQEREASGELAARLDDARSLLARQDLPDEELTQTRPRDAIERITPPARRVNNSRRKPPMAQIGTRTRAADPDEDIPLPDEADDVEGSYAPSPSPRPARPRPEESSLRWLPVATGLAEPATPRR